MKKKINDILRIIASMELDKENVDIGSAGYINQRVLISSLFKEGYSRGQIILRLTVIDSLYSTNAAYSYFSFEEMADKIYELGNGAKTAKEKQKAARDYFYKVAKGGADNKCLFSEPYGYQKNLSEGSKQMSLLSKYAYYELLQDPETYPLGFPIYDRLAKEAYPLVRKMLGEKDYYSMSPLETPTIEQYVKCLTQLRKGIFDDDELFMGYQQFDILDAYLWRMGKFSDGNLSLLMGRNDYEIFITNIGLAAPLEKNKKTRKDTPAYQNAMRAKYAQAFPQCKDPKKYNFNELVLHQLVTEKKPFKGIATETYLSTLLLHWKEFISYKDKGPKRGISF